MSERHAIAGPARGECLPEDRVGACVRLPLDGPPSLRWSDALTAHLAVALTGHPGVGHLRLNHVVQGADIVLEGIEPVDAEDLGPAVRAAMEAADRACERAPEEECRRNMEQVVADRVARAIEAGVRVGR
jgi:hypothetical protein